MSRTIGVLITTDRRVGEIRNVPALGTGVAGTEVDCTGWHIHDRLESVLGGK
jgi:hypothetical protein